MPESLKGAIRDVPNFPKKGIIFKDIAPLLQDGAKFREAIDAMAGRYAPGAVDEVFCVEARGFLLGAAIAYKLGAGIVMVRKEKKLPFRTHRENFELEYGQGVIEVHQDAIRPGARVVIVDDVLATGGTAEAVCRLVKKLGGEIVEAAFLIELTFLKGKEKLKGIPLFSLIQY